MAVSAPGACKGSNDAANKHLKLLQWSARQARALRLTNIGDKKTAGQKRLATGVLLSSVVASLFGPAHASELSGNVALTSEYIFRGQALSDGNPALQAGIEYAHDSGLFAGAWATTIDLRSASGRRDLQLNYYAGYHFASESPVGGSLSLFHYTFPGQSGARDYNYTELLATAYFGDSYLVEAGYADEYYGFDWANRHVELRGNWPLPNAWVIGAGLGWNDIDAAVPTDYLYWDLGVSARYSRLTIDLRWFDNETQSGALSWMSAESQLVATLSVAF